MSICVCTAHNSATSWVPLSSPSQWGHWGTERLSNSPRVTEWCLALARLCISKQDRVSVKCIYACTCAWMPADVCVCVCVGVGVSVGGLVCTWGVWLVCACAQRHFSTDISKYSINKIFWHHNIASQGHTSTQTFFFDVRVFRVPKILPMEKWEWKSGPAEHDRSREAQTPFSPGVALEQFHSSSSIMRLKEFCPSQKVK